MSTDKKLTVSTSPFLHDKATTPWIMYQVVYSLIPVIGAAYYFFGLGALAVLSFSVAGCLATEVLFSKTAQDNGKATYSFDKIKDGSALITGLLLGLTLPPGFPLWMAFLGGVVSIGMGKMIWGGLGQNVFNPALVGRAFLQATFPTAITTWSPPDGRYFEFRGNNIGIPFFKAENVDGVTTATPLSKMKFDHYFTDWQDLLFGNTGGSLGETCGILFVLAGIYLIARKIIHWRIPVALLLTVIVFSGIFWLIDPLRYPSPVFMLFSGGLMLGTVYMATDLVTSPITPKGAWIYAIGIGVFVVLIRLWGGLPEGVMYAILLMNAATPLINKYVKVKTYGYK
ncbi:MAG: RnfABCDGE type electron transport complex subunit D [Saprospiraceae bacterium]|nr:RnfABCDGE type electron transport complex subunit D [Saprospiraceae bacterium]